MGHALSIILLMVVAGLLVGLRALEPAAMLLGLFAAMAFFIVVHECVHALAAVAMGMPVFEVRFGSSEPWVSFRVAGVRVGVGPGFWQEGGCIAGGRRTPWRSAVFIASPALVHLLLVVAALPFALAEDGGVFAWAVVLANAWLFHSSVSSFSSGGEASDGLLLRRLLWDREAVLAELGRAAAIVEVHYASLDGDYDRSNALAIEAARLYPQDQNGQYFLAQTYAQAGKHEEALRTIEESPVKEPPEDERFQASLGNLFGERARQSLKGTILLCMGRHDDAARLYEQLHASESLAEARPYWQGDLAFALLLGPNKAGAHERGFEAARDAYELAPWLPHVRLTLALARLERGELTMAAGLLKGTSLYEYEVEARALRVLLHARCGKRSRARRKWRHVRALVRFPDLRAKVEHALQI